MNNKASSTAPKPTRKAVGISRSFIAALSRNLALATLAALGLSRAEATNYSWDPGLTAGVTLGGAGTWDLTTGNWFDGANDVLWPNNVSLTDVAVFGGTGGAVVIDTAADTGVAANGLIFSSGGYTISGAVAGEVINLGGTTPTITVSNGTDTDAISAILTGTAGLVKSGAGRLNLTGANTALTGTISVLGGTLGIVADNNLGVAANTVTLDGGTLSAGATFTSARTITLGAGGGTVDVDPTFTFTASTALVANANTLNKTGSGTLSLSSASTRSGVTNINNGKITVTNLTALGTGAVNVAGATSTFEINTGAGTSAQAVNVSNGGTFQWTQNAQLTVGATGTLSFQGTGGTLFVGGTGSTGKVLVNAGLIASDLTATVTKTGTGVLQLAGANNNFLGNLTISAGTVEFQQVDAIGTGTKTIVVNNGGEFVNNSGAGNVRHNFTLNTGATISANGTVNVGVYSGAINMAGNANAALRYFQTTTTANGFTISGAMTGSGSLTATAPAAATLTISGNRSAHTGQIIAGTNATVAFSTAASLSAGGFGVTGGTVQVRPVNLSSPVVGTSGGINAIYYNLGSNPGTASNSFAVDQLYLYPRTFAKTDLNVNMPNGGVNGDWPIVPVLGFTEGLTVGGQNDGVMWKGLINITNAATYQFSGTNDDNLTLWIDGVNIGSIGVTATNANIGAGVALSSGAHSIVVKHTEGGGGGYATLSYNGGAGSDAPSTVLVPSTAFSTGSLANIDVGPITSTGGTVDIAGPSSTSSLTLGNGTLTLTSSTIDNLTVASATINAATPTLAPTTGALIFTGAIGQDTGGRALTIAGPYLTEFQGVNTYTGLTTVTGGQLRLNAAGGNSIAANLTVNAVNANGVVNNVVLARSNQIVDTATVTMTAGNLDLGANSDTIATLAMNGGVISGTTGVLTVTNAPTLTAGTIAANLAGNWTLSKTGVGSATLSGNNTYTGQTSVSNGILNAFSANALGAGGAGNGTTVTSGASLRLANAAMPTEGVTAGGTGVSGDATDGAVRNLSGQSSIGSLTTSAATTVRVDSGELVLNGALDTTLGALTKSGAGVLTFATNQASVPTVTLTGGALGFSGTQSFGTASVPVGFAYRFSNDPGAGVTSVTVPSGSALIGGYAVDNAFVGKINASSTGALLLGADNSNNLSLAGATVGLGAAGLVNYSGTLTPNAAGYNFANLSGQGSIIGLNELTVSSVLSGSNPLTLSSGTVNLTGVNTFVGGITVTGGTLRTVNNTNLGDVTNVVTLNGGTLQALNIADNTGFIQFTELGNQVNGGARTISLGASGGTIDTPARQINGNSVAISGPNQLIGTGALTKTGLGTLFILNSTTESGGLTIAAQGGTVDVRSAGTLAGITGPINILQSGVLNIDGQNGLGQRQFIAGSGLTAFTDRIGGGPVTLAGGTITFTSRGGTTSNAETFGNLTLGVGQSALNANSNAGTSSSLLTFNALNRVTGSTVRVGGNLGTLGSVAAGNTEIFFTGQATATILPYATNVGTGFLAYNSSTGIIPATLTTATTNASIVAANIADQTADFALAAGNSEVNAIRQSGGAIRNLTFAAQTDTLFLTSGAYLSDGSAFARNIGTGGAAVATNTQGQLTAGPLSANAAPRELFLHNNVNTLTVFSKIVDNNAQPVTVVKDLDGTVTLQPNVNITGTWAANVNNFTVTDTSTIRVGQPIIGVAGSAFVASIIDGTHFTANGAPTAAGTGAAINLGVPNTNSGGVYVTRGQLNSASVGALGAPLTTNNPTVVVKNAILSLNNIGGVVGSLPGGYTGPVYDVTDQSAVILNANSGTAAGMYNTNTDRFSIGAGSVIAGVNTGTGAGLNSLTRVATPTSFTSGGQVYLAPGAIVKHTLTNAANQGAGTLTIQNLGTAADLFFAPSNYAGAAQTVTVGAGTPWKGLSSDRTGNLTWGGTIYANSDFVLQGLTRDGGITSLVLGPNSTAANNQGGTSIINNTSGPITASIVGGVVINEDEPVFMPSNLTFVITPGAIFQPNTQQALGFGANQAHVLVQAGGTLDPGNYTALGATANTTRNADGSLNGFQGLPYAVPSPVNGPTIVEAGGRLIINDPSGIGSAPAGTLTLRTNSVLELGNTNAFFGRGTYGLTQSGALDTTGLANTNQFVFENNVINRITADNIYKITQFVPANNQVVEIFGATRTLTNQNNPFIIPVTGTPTIAPENYTIGNGSVLTNDNVDRQVSVGRGRLILANGSTIAATTQTYLNLQQPFEIPAGATVTIGTSKFIDGTPRLGGIQLLGPQSNTIDPTATVNIADGAQLLFGAANVWPDTYPISLPTAVTAFPSAGALALQPGNGTSLNLNVANFIEYTGAVTGNGAIIGNQAGTALGMNFSGNVTSNVVFKSTNGQQPSLLKSGTGTLTLTGNSDSQGLIVAQQGSVVISNGTGDWNEVRPQRGASIVVDNTTNATNNRLGLPGFLVGQGGTFELKGNASTSVREQFNALASGAGNFVNQAQNGMNSVVKVTPGGGSATTTLSLLSIEAFNATGQRVSSYVFNSPSVGNLPMAYPATGGITPNVGNNNTALIEVVAPSFSYNGTISNLSGLVYGASGSTVMGLRNDLLGDANGDGIPEGFATQDGVVYAATNTSGTAVITGLPTTVGLAPGMLVTGAAGIPAGTRIQSVDSATQVTLTANTTAAATNLNVIVGGLRNLAASEYSSTFRDNQTVGLNVGLSSGTTNVTGDSRIQSLTLNNGSVLNINGTLPFNATSSRVVLNSSGIFVPSGATSTINGSTSGGTESFIQNIGGASVFLHTWGDLNVNTKIFTDVALVKTGPGTVNFGAGAWNGFRGTFQIDGGTVNLGAGDSVQNIRSTTGSTATNFYINAGTLNLNGNSQEINLLNSANELPGQGGTVTSSTAASLVNVGGGRFSGVVAGSIALDKVGNNTLLLTNDNTFSGATTLRAGTLQLRDSGKLSGTSGITVMDATLQLDNSYLSNVTNRIPAATPITLRNTSTINITGAAGQLASQTFNTVNLLSGTASFTSNAGGSGANEIIIGNLVRAQGPNGGGGGINFQQNYGFLGTAGNTTTAIRNFITNVNGSALAPNDGIVAGWAVVAGSNFATYQSSTGIGAMGNTADGFRNYDSTDITTATATQNVNDGTAARTLTANANVNSIRSVMAAAATWTLNNGVGINIDTGGFITDANQTLSLVSAANASGNSITSNSGELDLWVNQNTTGINIPITGAIDLVKSGPGSMNLRPEGNYTVTNTSGTNVLTTTTTTGLVVGMPISGTGIPAGSTITGITPGVSFTISNNTTAAVTAAAPMFGNTYTGKTIVNVGGTFQLNAFAAGQPGYRVIPGDLQINGVAIVQEANVPNQINPAANITFAGGGRLNMLAAANTTETLNSLIFLDGSGTNVGLGLDRASQQNTSVVNLTASTAITANNTNPTGGVPFIGGFIGSVGFTPSSGASTLLINSPTANNGVQAVGLRMDGAWGAVPTGIAEGGLIKAGNGLLAVTTSQTSANATNTVTATSNVVTTTSTAGLFVGMPITGTGIPAGTFITAISPNTSITLSQAATAGGTNVALTANMVDFNQTGTTYNGTTASLTDVFNVQSGIVRMDNGNALGSNSANTTVQSGAVLLGSLTTANTVVPGSIKLKDGALLATDGQAFSLGNATLVANNQSVLNVPSGNVTIGLYDYFLQGTNANNITVNGRITGAGNINVVGQGLTQGNGGGSVFQISNPILTGTGASDFTGTLTVGTNAIVLNQVALPAVTTNVRQTGDALGSAATIALNGGRFRVRDDGSTTATVPSNTTITYGNPVSLTANSFMDLGRVNATDTGANNSIAFGTLTVPSGTQTLTVDSNTSTAAAAGAGNYIALFNSLDGGGNFFKAGAGRLQLNAIAGTYTGTLGIAGPSGNAVAPTFNVIGTPNLILPASTTVPGFAVSGIYATEGAKTLNVTGALTVNSNAGNNAGILAVVNTTTLSAGSVVNNGYIGAVNGAGTITASGGFSGSGTYLSFNQPLTLAGGGVSGIKVAGNNTVNATGTSNTLTGAEVQSGTLRLANPAGTSTGTISVLGAAATTPSGTSNPVTAINGVLNFDGTGGTFTHTGSVSNSGTVRASGGTVTITGSVDGTATIYKPGLMEGYTTVTAGALDTTATRPANPANFGVRLEPRMFQTNVVTQNAVTGHTDNDLWVYTGYVKDNDGVFSFIENEDDSVAIWVDGVKVLQNGTFNQVTSTAYSFGQIALGNPTANANAGTPSQNFGPGVSLPGLGSGWHLLELRVVNGAGGAGPATGNGFGPNYGLGFKDGIGALDGADAIKPIDNGTGNLFVTPIGGKGSIQVDASSTLNVGSFSQTAAVTFAGGASSTAASLNVTGGNSSTDGIAVTGTSTPRGNIDVANGFTVTAGTLSVATGGTLSVNPTSNGTVVVTAANTLNAGSTVDVVNGTLNVDTTSVGSGTGSVQVETGARLIINGSLGGSVNVGIGATLKGAGTIVGASTLGIGSTLQPDRTSAVTALTFNNTLLLGSQATYEFEAKSGGLSDSVVFSGPSSGLTIAGDWTVKLFNAGFGSPVGATFVLFDGDVLGNQLNGGLGSVGNPTIDYGTTGWAGGSITYDAPNNDIILSGVVPEPGSAALLLGGLALLTGTRRKRRS